MPTRRPARQPEPPTGATRTERETAAATVAGRLRIPIEQARLIVGIYRPRGAFATLGWELRTMPLPELETLHADVQASIARHPPLDQPGPDPAEVIQRVRERRRQRRQAPRVAPDPENP